MTITSKKERIYNEFGIKIKRVVDVKKISKGFYESIDKFYLVDIKESGGSGISFTIEASGIYGKDLRKVFKTIQKELHLL